MPLASGCVLLQLKSAQGLATLLSRGTFFLGNVKVVRRGKISNLKRIDLFVIFNKKFRPISAIVIKACWENLNVRASDFIISNAYNLCYVTFQKVTHSLFM